MIVSLTRQVLCKTAIISIQLIAIQWLFNTHLTTIIRTLLLEPTTLVIVLTTGETNLTCSSKMATLERMRTFLERYLNVYVCAVNVRGGRRQEAGGRREVGGEKSNYTILI